MAKRPRVSVIIPVYNTEQWLPRCLDSIIHQTLQELEIICIDDASIDGSRDILESYAQKDRRIRLLRNAVNAGVGASRNLGLRAATGDYVGFVDSDDFVLLSFYQRLVNAAREVEIVKGDIWGFDNESEEPGTREYYAINPLVARNKNWFCYGFTSAIFKRELLERHAVFFPERMRTMEDPCFTIHAVLQARHVALVDDALYFYAENPASATRTLGVAEVVSTTCCACRLIGEMVKAAGVSLEIMPVVAFCVHTLQGAALNPGASVAEVRTLTDAVAALYEEFHLPDEFFYACIQYFREKSWAIEEQGEFFAAHEEEINDMLVRQNQSLEILRKLKNNVRRAR